MTQTEALRLALDALEHTESRFHTIAWGREQDAITAIKAALEAKDEPVGYWQGEFSKDGGALLCIVPQESIFGRKYRNIPLYTTSPQRTWVGLTNIDYAGLPREQVGLVLWAEAKLKEKNYDRI